MASAVLSPPPTTNTEKESASKKNESETSNPVKTEPEPVAKADKEPPSFKDADKSLNKPIFDLCGLPPYDGTPLERATGPCRIKMSMATTQEREKLNDLIGRCFSPDALAGKRLVIDPNEVLEVCRTAQKYFEAEPILMEDIPFGITIVGDLHGQLHDLWRVFLGHAKDGKPGYECAKFLFLGDYVDRGRQSLEVVMALFALKILYPDNFILLRGNHEFLATNSANGFIDEIKERYLRLEASEEIYFQINETFCWMSVAAIIGDSYLCVHAGVSPSGFTRNQLRGLIKPFMESNEDVLIHDMVWADPAIGLRGSIFNTERHTSVFFGLEELVQALAAIDCTALFRGHDMMMAGFDNQMDICHTVFTATAAYDNSDNDGAYVRIDEKGAMQVHTLKMSKNRATRDRSLFDKDEGDKKVEEDKKEETTCEKKAGSLATVEDEDSYD